VESNKITVNRLALAEARLVIAKLLWRFDIELEGDHSTWVQDARFYVSIRSTFAWSGYQQEVHTDHLQVLWKLQPLKVRLTSVR
jgi:hypothetical protein